MTLSNPERSFPRHKTRHRGRAKALLDRDAEPAQNMRHYPLPYPRNLTAASRESLVLESGRGLAALDPRQALGGMDWLPTPRRLMAGRPTSFHGLQPQTRRSQAAPKAANQWRCSC